MILAMYKKINYLKKKDSLPLWPEIRVCLSLWEVCQARCISLDLFD